MLANAMFELEQRALQSLYRSPGSAWRVRVRTRSCGRASRRSSARRRSRYPGSYRPSNTPNAASRSRRVRCSTTGGLLIKSDSDPADIVGRRLRHRTFGGVLVALVDREVLRHCSSLMPLARRSGSPGWTYCVVVVGHGMLGQVGVGQLRPVWRSHARPHGRRCSWRSPPTARQRACPARTEREGFEPSNEVNPRYAISSRARSAAPAPLQVRHRR
jgi:hypothetical protein